MKIGFLRSGSGDWVGLYVDGKLVKEGHSISEEDMARLIAPKASIKTVYGSEDLEEFGNQCPSTWEGIGE